ncbi:TrbG/VirB9 family P-type conjugative transfer protein [uncultured Selenomonas sp.]|uniref:TrbG/VirB9 family P-type conjugative transfer protein n=1 Tax=uncultured Selenomonas sp. TaxID=159275 RepID=UPI0028DB141E|nr:TrbG/VirB9 family P-type conjugative transfer protein [uncultured Selenomonas sp.]
MMQFQKKMKKNLAAAVLAGLIVTPYGTPSYAADAAAAETHTEAAAPSMEETLAEWMATHPTQDTAEPERAESPLVTDTPAQQRKPLTKSEAREIGELRDSIYAVSMSQTEILNLIDRLNARLDRYEQEQERVRVAVPAPTSGALVHPAPASHVNDTQDAVNAQGNATMTFAYAPNQLYKIYCRRGYLTDLAFRKGETIQFVGGGDTAGWAVSSATVDGIPHLYIKPVVEVSTTNLIVTTNKRSYQLIVHSADWYNPMVSWTYATEDHQDMLRSEQKNEAARTAAVHATDVESLDFSYKVKGKNAEYRPETVFSDGMRVYLKFNKLPQRQVPIFIQEKGSRMMTLVNYQQKDNYYIIDAPFERAQLRVSEHENVTIEHKAG